MKKRNHIVHSDYAEISLPHNYTTKIDLDDIDLAEHNWGIVHDMVTRSTKKDGKTKTYFIHRIIMERKLQKELLSNVRIFHVNGDRLDNRKENLIAISRDEEYPETKICSKCGAEKSLSEFFRNSECKYGRLSKCKECALEYYKQPEVRKRNTEYERNRNYKRGFHKPMSENKACSSYLGVVIAENILSHIFEGVEVMPRNNRKYDLICKRGYKIDVKSSTLCNNEWGFKIRKNNVADYFICLGFDNREDLNLIKIWLIPGSKVNHLGKLGIKNSEKSLGKWAAYERPNDLNKAIACCASMRGK